MPDTPRERYLFYISRSLAKPEDAERILETSRHLNQQRGITGALLFTGGHFAQLLEGPPPALAVTMHAIQADPRHETVTVLVEHELKQRRFDDWNMAFIEAPGVDDLIAQLLAAPDIPAARADRLLKLMFDSPLR